MDPQAKITDAAIALDSILEAIRIGDIDELTKYLSTVAIEYISANDQIALLDVMLETAYNNGSIDMVNFIFEYFDNANSESTNIPTFSLFLMRSGIGDHILSFLGTIMKLSFELVIQGINNSPMSELTYEGCLNAEKVFGDPDQSVLLRLETFVAVDPKGTNKYILRYVREKLGKIQPIKPKPAWIVNNSGNKIIPLQSELIIPPYPPVNLMSPGDLADKFVESLIKQGVNTPKHDNDFTRDMIASHYGISTLEEKLVRINDYNVNIANVDEIEAETEADDVLFLVYGPNNTNVDQPVTPMPDGNACEQFGGCRMFLCTCSEADKREDEDIYEYDDFGVPEVDWFTGVCQECSGKIEFRHYAVRRPLRLGGWVGCFCSISCVQNTVKNDDMIVITLIERLTILLDQNGIQDRRYDDKAQIISTD